MSKATKLSFETIENPYDHNLNRVDTGVLSAAGTVDLGSAGDSDDYINRELSGEDFEDLWISSWIKSRNYKPKTQGFMIDGKLGYIECMKLYVGQGGIVGGKIDIPDITTANSAHIEADGDTYWGCNVANWAADNDNANAYVLKTGVAKFQDITIVGGSIDGTSTIGGRTSSILATAINASGHFADNAIDTAAGTILADFTFGASGAIQIGEYVNGVSGDLKLSPTGILARNSTGATTFSVNGTTGIAVLNGLVVGTNVDLGTAQDSAGVTTIVGNTVTTGYINALSITTVGAVTAGSITGLVITGGTVRTSDTSPRVELNGTNGRVDIFNPTNICWFGGAGNVDGNILHIFQADTTLDHPPVDIASGQIANVINGRNVNSTISNRPSFRFDSNSPNSETMYVTNTHTTAGGAVSLKVNAQNSNALYLINNSSSGYGTLYISQSGTSILIGTNVGGCCLTKAGVWTDASSKTLKENFESIKVLDILKNLDITRYNYIGEKRRDKKQVKESLIDTEKRKKYSQTNKGWKGSYQDTEYLKQKITIKENTRIEKELTKEYAQEIKRLVPKHISPMAEDFYEAFGIGDDKGISPKDLAGVALQAIKELTEKVETLENKLK